MFYIFERKVVITLDMRMQIKKKSNIFMDVRGSNIYKKKYLVNSLFKNTPKK